MDIIISYFTALKDLSSHRSVILFGGITFFMLIEYGIPFFRSTYSKVNHTALNIFFTLTTIVVNFAMAGILFFTSYFAEVNQIGILNWLGVNGWVFMILGLLLLDLIGAWTPHYVEHRFKWLWQFHVIHHTDQHVDVTTANRHHPGESVIRFVFTTLAVLLVGAPVWLIMLYQSLSVVLSQFNHSNVKIPLWLDQCLRILICTPYMHRVHHHYRQPYSDKNFGNIFSLWDRIFGTYVAVDNEKLVFGVDTYMDQKEASNVMELLKLPFSGYRKPIEYDQEEQL